MIKTFLLSLVIVSVSLAVYLYFYLGVSKPVDISCEKRGPLNLMFKSHRGAYHEIGETIRAVEALATAHQLPCPLTFGEFLDDPDTVDQDRLRAHAGCVLGSPDLQTSLPDTEFELRPEASFVVAHFSGSPAIGPFKVYPNVKDYLKTRRLKSSMVAMEIYRVEGQDVTTEYLFPVASCSL